ncbi:MAG: hypothetical protein KGY78_09950 [Anaerolineae bacterium]|nr:hypothetical protein [Anaerolineae bacterium]
MTLREMLEEITEIRNRYPQGTPVAKMDPGDAHRILHLQKAASRKARTNQQTMTSLLDATRRQPGRQTYMDLAGAKPKAAQMTLLEAPVWIYGEALDVDEEIAELVRKAQHLGRTLDRTDVPDNRRRDIVANLTQLEDELNWLKTLAN